MTIGPRTCVVHVRPSQDGAWRVRLIDALTKKKSRWCSHKHRSADAAIACGRKKRERMQRNR